jgi:signal transduction histidine kinase
MAETTPDHATTPTTRPHPWDLLWAVFFYGVLSFATYNALAFASHGSVRIGLIVTVVAALALWHGVWRWPRPKMTDRTYFVGAAVLWVASMVLDPDFLILSLGIFAPLCFHDLAWGTVALVGTGGAWLWLEWTERGAIPWNTVLWVTLLVAAGLLGVGYFGTMMRQSRERQRLIEELRRTQAELAEAERQSGVLEERHRLAREVHDTLTQGFASVVMFLEAASALLESDSRSRRHVERALETARENLVESRRLVWAMRPAALTDASLTEALDRLGAQLGEDTDLRVETVIKGARRDLDRPAETALLRITQEAMANVRRHAHADKVTVTLCYMDDRVVLDVHDNGVGFTPSRGGSGVGLSAMQERAGALGGILNVESAPGEGTVVVAEIPTSEDRLAPTGGDYS